MKVELKKLFALLDDYNLCISDHAYWKAKFEIDGNILSEENKNKYQTILYSKRAVLENELEKHTISYNYKSIILDILESLEMISSVIKNDLDNLYKAKKDDISVFLLENFRQQLIHLREKYLKKINI